MRVSLVSLMSHDTGCAFIQPFIGVESGGIHMLAAALREAGHQVQLLDAVALQFSVESVQRQLITFAPEMIGISPTLSVMPETLMLATELKRWNSHCTVVLGGHHATMCAREILAHYPDIDFVAIGEAEESLPAFVAVLERGGSPSVVPGFMLRDKDGIRSTGSTRIIASLDALPFQARDTLAQMVGLHPIVGANIQSSRGCPYTCSFCSTPTFYEVGPKYRRRSPTAVVNEMELIHSEFGTHLFNFTDDIFLIPGQSHIDWVGAFTRELRGRNLPIAFAAMMRSEVFRAPYVDAIIELKRAGLHHVLIGIESATESMLDVYSKRSRVEDYLRAIRFLHTHEIFLACAFIAFNPHTTIADVEENVRFLRDVVEDPILYHYVSQVTVFPGTALAKTLAAQDLLISRGESSRDGLAYRMVDPIVDRLVAALRPMNRSPLPSDSAIERIRYYMAYARATGQISHLTYSEVFQEMSGISSAISHRHHDFIASAITLARGNLCGELDQLVADYLDGCAAGDHQALEEIEKTLVK